MGRDFALVALATGVLAGCAGAPLTGLRCEAQGGAPWREYRGPHVVLATDLPPARARALICELEVLWARAGHAIFERDEAPAGRTRVVLVDGRAQHTLFGGLLASIGRQSPLHGEPVAVAGTMHQDSVRRAVVLDATASAAAARYGGQPPWFKAGLERFVGALGEGEGSDRVGSTMRRMPWLREEPLPSARELLAPQFARGGDKLQRAQEGSYVLYQWLAEEQGDRFARYREALAGGTAPEEAWRGALPEYDPTTAAGSAALDRELAAFQRRSRDQSWPAPGGAPPAVEDVPLGSADVHMLLVEARLAWRDGTQGRRELHEELEEILREDPLQPMALAYRARLAGTSPVPALRAAAAARPGDWRIWAVLADALAASDEPGEEEAWRTTLHLQPSNRLAARRLAELLVGSGRYLEAEPLARQAAAARPADRGAREVLAAALAGGGRCPEARRERARASGLPGAARTGPEVGRVRIVDQRCGDPVPPAAR